MSADTVRLCAEIEALRAENEALRGALKIVANNMRALEDGGCNYPRVVESFRIARAALAASTSTEPQP